MARIWCDVSGVAAVMEKQHSSIRLRFGRGFSLIQTFPATPLIEIVSPELPTNFFTSSLMPVVCERTARLCAEWNAAVELFPVQVKHEGDVVPANYFAINVLLMLDCFDRLHSVYTDDKGTATKVLSLHLQEKDAEQSPIFIIKNVSPPMIASNDRFAAALQAANLSGVTFVAPQEWRNPAESLYRRIQSITEKKV
jgi:hypothetical protein